MTRIVVQGWRFLGHSYAFVNQHQCLELLTRPGVSLSMIDAPFPNASWAPMRGLLSPEQEAAIEAIPAGTAPGADVLIRMEFPYDPSPSEARRTFAFMTAENSHVPPAYIKGGRPVAEAVKASPTTILTPSKWSRDGLLRSGVKGDRVQIVPHGVDPEVFRPPTADERARLRRECGWDDAFVLLNVGAMTRNKGVDLLLRAVAELADELPRVILVLKGFDAMFNSQGEFLTSGSYAGDALAKLGPRVQYYGGAVTERQMADLYKAADAYVCPYRGEGFNIPPLEGAACGLPVVCTAGGPTDDFITSEFGLKVAATMTPSPTTVGGNELKPSLPSLVSQVRRVCKDAKFVEAARAAAPAHVHAGYTWKKIVDRLLEVVGS